MDLRRNGPAIHGVFCIVAGLIFLGFMASAFLGPVVVLAEPSHISIGGSHWLMPSLAFLGFGLLFQVLLGVWVGFDAQRRGMNGFLWGALVCFTCVVGLLVYLIVITAQSNGNGRARTVAVGARTGAATAPASSCGHCGGGVRPEFKICPHCGEALDGACPQCHARVEPGWKFCASCRTAL